jgi:hypothetical protein
VDVNYIVVNTPALVLRCVGHHDVVGLAQQDFRVELLALADGASHHLFTPPPGPRLRAELIRDISVDLAVLLLAFVLDNEEPAVVGTVLAGCFLYLL